MNWIIIFPIMVILFNIIIVFLNVNSQKGKMNDNQLFDQKEFERFTKYGIEKSTMKLIHIISIQILLILVILFIFKFLEREILQSITNEYIYTSLIVLIMFTLYQIITTSYEAVDVFHTESKYGFNKTTSKLFIKEQIIDYIATCLVLLITVNFLLFLYMNLDTSFLIYGGVFISILLILYNIFYIILFMPIMYKSKPLENQELINEITLLAEKENFNIEQIVSINASERTTKINAFFSGYGKQKKVMVFDTMEEKLTVKQITSVIAHEIGHSKYHHMLKDLLKDLIVAYIYLSLFYVLMIQDTSLLTSNDNTFLSSVVCLFIFLGPIHIFIKTITNTISRKHEKSADLYVENIGYGKELSECLLLAAKSNLGNLYPHPLFVFFKFDHPSLFKRLSYLK